MHADGCKVSGGAMTQRTDEPELDAYTAFKETEACKRCGGGESWTIKGPDGLCIGSSWEGDDAECRAEEWAQELNRAYELGKNPNGK